MRGYIMSNTARSFGLAGLLLVSCSAAALAQSVTVPGEQVGLSFAPAPEGVYALSTFNWHRLDGPDQSQVGVNIPILLWSTPWKVLGARIEPVLATPTFFQNTNNPAGVPNRDISWNVGTFVGSIFAWDLGNHVGVSYIVGAYLNDLDANRGSTFTGSFGNGRPNGAYTLNQLASTVIRNEVVANYTGDGWTLAAALTHNFPVDAVGQFGGAVGRAIGPVTIADGLNLDLTATKTFDKFEIGAIGYGTTDLPVSTRDIMLGGNQYVRSGRFALGGLVGYDFGAFKLQFYVARDVATRAVDTRGREAYQTDGWFRISTTLYTAPKARADLEPLISKP
ncbi:transporter [Methylobacterium sp. Leaf361]|uniref:transporter n=1 Tax=Methylobacterium sp. Leaf361 TaxID=1736352 RepID=UPI001FCCF460|nr:transporter [Methylobacterium sp. Leaf361]